MAFIMKKGSEFFPGEEEERQKGVRLCKAREWVRCQVVRGRTAYRREDQSGYDRMAVLKVGQARIGQDDSENRKHGLRQERQLSDLSLATPVK